MPDPLLVVRDLTKSFTLHNRGHAVLPVLDRLSFSVEGGECVALRGPSGVGKSTALRLIYGNYKALGGRILVAERGDTARMIDVAAATPRDILRLRRDTIGYVSQFLRAVPRVPAEDVVAEPLLAAGIDAASARSRARALLDRMNVPERMWKLPPATFSGGEQQRVNIARSLVYDYPVLLLDEPTAALDRANRAVVIALIGEAKARGAALVGIFHDDEVRESVADRVIAFAPAAQAA